MVHEPDFSVFPPCFASFSFCLASFEIRLSFVHPSLLYIERLEACQGTEIQIPQT
jgi:hypothetical protein